MQAGCAICTKMWKFVQKCKSGKNRLIQVIHIENHEKGGKIDVFLKLSTLSTLNGGKMGDYSRV